MANELKEKHQRLKKVRTRNIVLNSICILLAGSGIWWTANYFWRYINYEVTNDAFVDQYIAPLNIRASGYIKEVRSPRGHTSHTGRSGISDQGKRGRGRVDRCPRITRRTSFRYRDLPYEHRRTRRQHRRS